MANSVDSDEMQCSVVSDLGLRCLSVPKLRVNMVFSVILSVMM